MLHSQPLTQNTSDLMVPLPPRPPNSLTTQLLRVLPNSPLQNSANVIIAQDPAITDTSTASPGVTGVTGVNLSQLSSDTDLHHNIGSRQEVTLQSAHTCKNVKDNVMLSHSTEV